MNPFTKLFSKRKKQDKSNDNQAEIPPILTVEDRYYVQKPSRLNLGSDPAFPSSTQFPTDPDTASGQYWPPGDSSLPPSLSTNVVAKPPDHGYPVIQAQAPPSPRPFLLGHTPASEKWSSLKPPDNRHIYDILNPSKHQIRLLRLKPQGSAYRGLTVAELKTFDLADCPPFQAVSYMWGLEIYGELLVNGMSFGARLGILHFLAEYASLIPDDYPRKFPHYASIASRAQDAWLWIDQISIDQSTVSERNHQVRLMSSIFSRATEVVAWLGDSDTSKFALRNLTYSSRDRTRDHLANIRDGLTSAPLWRRVWIHQEIMLANNVTLMAGNETLRWEILNSGRHILLQDPYFGSMQMQHFRELFNYRQNDTPIRDLPLLEVLEKLGSGECSDPMDHVFALQGMVREDQRLEVDYSLDPSDLIKVTCEMMIKTDDDLARNADRIHMVGRKLTQRIPGNYLRGYLVLETWLAKAMRRHGVEVDWEPVWHAV